jgi:hypothetical protein
MIRGSSTRAEAGSTPSTHLLILFRWSGISTAEDGDEVIVDAVSTAKTATAQLRRQSESPLPEIGPDHE